MASERPSSSTTSSSASSFSQLQDTSLRGFPALREKMKEKEERDATATADPLQQGEEQSYYEHVDDDEEDDDDELLGGLAFGVRGKPSSRRGTATSRDSRHVLGDQASADISIDEILAMDEEDEAEEAALLQTFVGDGSSSGPTLTNHFGDASIRTSSHGLDAHKQPKELNEVVLQQILMESTEDPLPDLAPKDYMDNIVKDLLPPPPPSNDKLNEGRRVGGYKLFRLRSTSSSSKKRPSSLSSITNDPIVLLPKPLRKVSMSMTSEAMRREAGFPTCVVVSRRCIAVGTAHGLVLLFDHLQELKRILGTSTDAEYGSVTAVDMMPSGDWLVCGHQKGHIVLWDIQTGTMIKTVTPEQAHPSAVIHLRFLSESQIISSDVTGTTYRITFTKSMWRGWTADTLLILNGRAGKVYALASLMSSPLSSALENPLNASALIAFCMPRLVTIVRLEPKIEILFKLGRPKNISASTLPYLSWCKRVVKKDDASGQLAACDPILAIGWGHHLQLLQVSSSSSTQGAESSSSTGENPADGSIRVHLLSSTITENEICGLEWLGNKLLLVLDVKDKLRVLDATDLKEIEAVDTKGMDLIYHTRFSKAQCSFHNSFRTLKDRVYLLGMDNIYWGHILSWEERITLLVEQRRWLDALSLALKFYEGRGNGLVDKGVGLPSNSQTRRSLVSDKIIQVLLYYLRTAVSAIFPSTSNTTISHNDLTSVSSTSSNSSDSSKNDRLVTKRMVRLGSICMEYLLHIARSDVLFEQIYPLYCKLGQRHTFLELMEPFILEEKLVYLPPELMQAFVSHYASKNMLKTVEQCILHLDLASMDFHHIVKLCREHYLSSGLIYVYNQGLEDYITPLDDMMRLIRSKRKTDLVKGETTSTTSDISTSGGSKWKSVGYKILLYVSYCLLGKAFPQGSIPRHLVTSVKVDVLNYLFQKNVVGEEEEYVHLVCMLLFDTKEFLSAISIAFDDPTIPPPKEEMEKPMLNHQQMLGVLEGIMVPVKSSLFNEEQVGYFFSFIAEYVAKERVSVSPALMNKVVSYLTRSPDASTAVKRQQLMLHIMSLPSARWDQNTLLMVEGASPEPFYAVAELYYRQRKDYKQVIRCYLKDHYRRTEVFTMLRTLLDDASIAEQQMQEIRQAVVANITDLIKIDPHASCSLITNYFTKDQNHQIMRELSKHPKLQYEYLDAILGPESVYQTSNLGSGRLAGELMEETTGKEMQQAYIALMCQFAPNKVYRHLQASDTRVSFEYCLALCKRHNITDATAYLLERTGDVISALDIILQKLKEEMTVMFAAQEANELNALPEAGAFPVFPHTKEEKKVQETLRAAISLCQRNSQRSGVDDAESVALWFRLLDALVVPLRDFKKKGRGLKPTLQGGSNAPSNKTKSSSRSSSSRPSPSLSFSRHRSASQTVYSLSVSEDESLPRGLARSTQAITLQIQNVLHNMMGYVPLQAILSKIVHDHGADDFGDFKSIIRGVLDSYSYEEAILRSVNKLLRGDMYDSFREYWYLRNRAYVPSKQTAASQQHSASDHHLSSAMMTKMKGTAMRGGNGVCHLCGATFSDPNFLLMEEKRSSVGVAVFPCGHCFHGSCLGKFRACPLCNRHNKKPNDKTKEKEKEEEKEEGGEEYRSRLPTERVQDLIANKNDSNKDPSRLGANTKDTIRASLNTNPENLKDYLQRVDKFKPQEYSRLDMLYQLAGQTRKKSTGRVTRATKTAKQERALKARSRVYPSSASSSGSSSGSWRRGVRLTAEELQEQGFQLQTMDKHS
ncbi:RING-type domain-containing protein [Balamuthia mandrillaris]